MINYRPLDFNHPRVRELICPRVISRVFLFFFFSFFFLEITFIPIFIPIFFPSPFLNDNDYLLRLTVFSNGNGSFIFRRIAIHKVTKFINYSIMMNNGWETCNLLLFFFFFNFPYLIVREELAGYLNNRGSRSKLEEDYTSNIAVNDRKFSSVYS